MINGLKVIKDFISQDEETALIHHIDSEPWDTSMKRRIQQYGHEYIIKKKKLSQEIRPLPSWSQSILEKLNGFFPKTPEQIIVNEYLPGQGISKHIDSPMFDEPVVSLSLLSSCVMNFIRDKQKLPLLLERRSLLIMTGESRWSWYHEIPSRKYDDVENIKVPRKRRVSLTFRVLKKNIS